MSQASAKLNIYCETKTHEKQTTYHNVVILAHLRPLICKLVTKTCQSVLANINSETETYYKKIDKKMQFLSGQTYHPFSATKLQENTFVSGLFC